MTSNDPYEELYKLPLDVLRGFGLAHSFLSEHYYKEYLRDPEGFVTYSELAVKNEQMTDIFLNMVEAKRLEENLNDPDS
jgi:hypothetical protein